MVLWRNYGTILKIMVLYWKLWYYTENYETSIYERKEQCWVNKNYESVIYNGKHFANMPKQLKFLNKYIAVKLWFTMEKLWYYGKKNYGTILKTIERFDLLWKKTSVFFSKL